MGRLSLKEVFKRLQKFIELSTLGRLVTSTDRTKFNPLIDCFIGKDGRRKGYNKWTLLKLMFLQLYVPLYTSIISRWFAGWNYIDLFAGSGVGKLEETDIVIAGSPIISLAFATKRFSNAYFVDIDRLKLSLLKHRVELLKELSRQDTYRDYIFTDLSAVKTKFFIKDANRAVFDIYSELEHYHKLLIKKVRRGYHNLVFIDPYGMEFHMKSLKRILRSSIRNDLIILFNSYAAGLQAYDHIHHGYEAQKLYSYLGEGWLDYIKRRAKDEGIKIDNISRNRLSDWLSDYYIKSIVRHNYVAVRIRLPLKLRSQQFDLIYASHKTKSGNPFINAIFVYKETSRRNRLWIS